MHLRGCALGAILASRDLYRPRHNECTIWGCPGTWPRRGIYALCMTCRYDTISRQVACTYRGVPVIGTIPFNPRHNDCAYNLGCHATPPAIYHLLLPTRTSEL